jgi:hypothetical protein
MTASLTGMYYEFSSQVAFLLFIISSQVIAELFYGCNNSKCVTLGFRSYNGIFIKRRDLKRTSLKIK